MFDYGTQFAHVYLVSDPLGPSLRAVARRCAHRIGEKAVVAIASQLLCALSALAARRMVHGAISPSTVRMGDHEVSDRVFLHDFEQHAAAHDVKDFASPFKRHAASPTYRDDLCSVAYVLLFLLRARLPWTGCSLNQTQRESVKKQATPDSLCEAGVPAEMKLIFEYVYEMEDHDVPDYQRLTALVAEWYARVDPAFEPPVRWADGKIYHDTDNDQLGLNEAAPAHRRRKSWWQRSPRVPLHRDRYNAGCAAFSLSLYSSCAKL